MIGIDLFRINDLKIDVIYLVDSLNKLNTD